LEFREPIPGLENVPIKYTKITYIDGEKGELYYRGYNIVDLFNNSTYEETAYLLLFGKLPSLHDLEKFKEQMFEGRRAALEVIEKVSKLSTENTLDRIKIGLILAAKYINSWPRSRGKQVVVDELLAIAPKILGLVHALTAYAVSLNSTIVEEYLESSCAELLCRALINDCERKHIHILDKLLIVYADHGLSASAFAATVVASTLSNLLYALEAAISALQGPLHGGALEKVAHMLETIPLEKVEEYVSRKLAQKEKLMGFGHRVYKTYDPRAKLLKRLAAKLALNNNGLREAYLKAVALELHALKTLAAKRVYPNVDFWAAALLLMMGVKPENQLSVFVYSRTAGWLAHIIEYLENNKILRPRAIYKGPLGLKYKPLESR